ncbi:MAG TPA: hypothetical protein DHV26_14630, partial [Cytophagales bacterium]|nr:hypothetical protein [Cytophagales bacterium]
IAVFFVLMGYTIELPVFQFASQKHVLFDALTPIELFFLCLTITCVYFLVTYFVLPSELVKNLKAMQAPIQEAYSTKFDYWLKSLIYEDQIGAEEHTLTVETIRHQLQHSETNVLVAMAQLNDMKVQTFIKELHAKADAKMKDAKSDVEREKVEILKKALESIDKLPAIWQAYIIACLVGSNSEFQNDMDIQRDISSYVKDLKEQEVKKARAEADTFEEKMKKEKQKYTTNDKV